MTEKNDESVEEIERKLKNLNTTSDDDDDDDVDEIEQKFKVLNTAASDDDDDGEEISSDEEESEEDSSTEDELIERAPLRNRYAVTNYHPYDCKVSFFFTSGFQIEFFI